MAKTHHPAPPPAHHGGGHQSTGHSGGHNSGGHNSGGQHSGSQHSVGNNSGNGHHRRGRGGNGEVIVVPGNMGFGYGNSSDDSYTPANGSDLGYYNPETAGGGLAAARSKAGLSSSGSSTGGGGWFDGIIKQFYDPKNGGLQIGGLGGAIAGALAGMTFLGTGSWLGIIGAGVMTLAGAWGGNKLSDAISSMFSSSTPEVPKTPASALAPARTAETPKSEITSDIKDKARGAAPATAGVGGGDNTPVIPPVAGPVVRPSTDPAVSPAGKPTTAPAR